MSATTTWEPTGSNEEPATNAASPARQLLNKVPQITIIFWIIKVLCTTVGETAADFLSVNLHLGLTNTTYIMGAFLLLALWFQFKARQYTPGLYWLVVVLLSIVGTLITDNLVDNFHISLVTTTIAFSIALAATFTAWYVKEKTLSVHFINSTRREAFYWLAILFTFALGTAAGDLIAEQFGLGYLKSLGLFIALIAVVAIAYFRFHINGILAFWIAYILTRPLGASIGDYLSQPQSAGGLGLGTVATSALFLCAILGLVVRLTITKSDTVEDNPARPADAA